MATETKTEIVSYQDSNFLTDAETATVASLVKQRAALQAYYKERTDIINNMFVALLVRQHTLLIGPPGTAKSGSIESFCAGVQASFFGWQVTKFSTPEEIFGPYSIPALKLGRYERNTREKLPEAEIIYLDEVFNANSSILNALNSAMNERVFEGRKIPLQCIYGATNFTPEDTANVAFYDRFLFRLLVSPISEPDAFKAMLLAGEFVGAPAISIAEVDAVRKKVPLVDISPVIGTVLNIWEMLRIEHISVSDRRYKWSLMAIRAVALLEERSRCIPDDVDILKHMLWTDKKDIPMVETIILKNVSPTSASIKNYLDQALSVEKEVKLADPDNKDSVKQNEALGQLRGALQTIKKIQGELGEYLKMHTISPKWRELGEKIQLRIKEIESQVMNRMIGG